jgi:hypothetical protein
VIAIIPWNAFSDAKPEPEPAPKERRDPLKLARYYQSLLDSGKFESRAALARYLGVSRARVTQVTKRLNPAQRNTDAQSDMFSSFGVSDRCPRDLHANKIKPSANFLVPRETRRERRP